MSWNVLPYESALIALLALFATRQAWRRARNRSGAKLWAWRGASAFASSLAVVALAATGAIFWYTHRSQPPPTSRRLFQGVTYVRSVRSRPLPLVIHVVKVDLQARGLRLLVTPG